MTKLIIPPISRNGVQLRLLEESDLATTLKWRNLDRVRVCFKNSNVISADAHLSWYQRYQQDSDDYVFVIEELERPVGQISIYNINWEKHEAEYGRLLIGPEDSLGRGIARRASSELIDFWNSSYGIQRFYLQVKSGNARAIALYDALGFTSTAQEHELTDMQLLLPMPAMLAVPWAQHLPPVCN